MYILLFASPSLYSLTVVWPFCMCTRMQRTLVYTYSLIRRTFILVGFILLLYTLCRLCHGWVKSLWNVWLHVFFSILQQTVKCYVDFGVISVHDSRGATDRRAEEDIRHLCCLVVSPLLFHRTVLAKRLQHCTQNQRNTSPILPPSIIANP